MGYNKSVKRQVATSLILTNLLKKSTTLSHLWLRRCPKQCYLNLTKYSYKCIPNVYQTFLLLDKSTRWIFYDRYVVVTILLIEYTRNVRQGETSVLWFRLEKIFNILGWRSCPDLPTRSAAKLEQSLGNICGKTFIYCLVNGLSKSRRAREVTREKNPSDQLRELHSH